MNFFDPTGRTPEGVVVGGTIGFAIGFVMGGGVGALGFAGGPVGLGTMPVGAEVGAVGGMAVGGILGGYIGDQLAAGRKSTHAACFNQASSWTEPC